MLKKTPGEFIMTRPEKDELQYVKDQIQFTNEALYGKGDCSGVVNNVNLILTNHLPHLEKEILNLKNFMFKGIITLLIGIGLPLIGNLILLAVGKGI